MGVIAFLGVPVLTFYNVVTAIFVDEHEKNSTSYVVTGNKNLSLQVLAYRGIVEKYAKKYGMEAYVNLILAVMMQESGGRGTDPMQCAEGGVNTRYPHVPNGIKDPEYSIECGIQELKLAMEKAQVTSPTDMDHIKLALQSYNYGSGYIDFALKRDGKYTEENAIAYSDLMCARPSWPYSRYGDKQYVQHVLQYYTYSGILDISTSAGEAANIPLEQRMSYLFPNGEPQTESEMTQYLKRISVPIINENGVLTSMNLTVHKKLEAELQAIFQEMADMGFKIKSSSTAAYCWRPMRGSGSRSHHSFGSAIDINWGDNPYVKGSNVSGSGYAPYKNPYAVTPEVVQIWKNHGFYWGGDWTSLKDYMHFTYMNH